MADDSTEKFRIVRSNFAELAEYFPEGMAAIGGYAVWLHSGRLEGVDREGTRDGDAMLSRKDFEELKTLHAVSDNARFGKHEFTVEGVDFDIYVEYEKTDIRVPVTEVLAHSVVIEGVRAASLEHLLVMKLDAALTRERTEHGEKDDRDIAKIVMLLREPDPGLLLPYLDGRLAEKLGRVGADHEVFRGIAAGNELVASKLQRTFTERLRDIEDRMKDMRSGDGREPNRGPEHEL